MAPSSTFKRYGLSASPARRWVGPVLVGLYLTAIVSANLFVERWGQRGLVLTAFLLIPFDLVNRDALQQRWQGRGLLLRLVLLTGAGSILTVLFSHSAARIAAASCIAFLAASTVDSIVFQLLLARPRLVRINSATVASSLVDSMVFPVVAFGVHHVSLSLCLAQAGSKILGGLAWSILLLPLFRRSTR